MCGCAQFVNAPTGVIVVAAYGLHGGQAFAFWRVKQPKAALVPRFVCVRWYRLNRLPGRNDRGGEAVIDCTGVYLRDRRDEGDAVVCHANLD